MQKKLYGMLFVFLLVLLASCLVSCVTQVPDVPICIELDIGQGSCVKIITGEEFQISDKSPFNGKTWWDMRPAMIQVPADSWVEIKKFIIDICKKTNQCQNEVTNWERSVLTIDSQLSKKQ